VGHELFAMLAGTQDELPSFLRYVGEVKIGNGPPRTPL
jgi:hypothetical protein